MPARLVVVVTSDHVWGIDMVVSRLARRTNCGKYACAVVNITLGDDCENVDCWKWVSDFRHEVRLLDSDVEARRIGCGLSSFGIYFAEQYLFVWPADVISGTGLLWGSCQYPLISQGLFQFRVCISGEPGRGVSGGDGRADIIMW